MTDKELNRTLGRMVKRLVRRFKPEQIILFGSHARGNARPDSDIDLLVVLPFNGSRREKTIELRVALHDFRVPKDIILVTPEEMAWQRDVKGTIVYPAVREGKVIYARN